jgi:hypothetical protein
VGPRAVLDAVVKSVVLPILTYDIELILLR